MKRRILIAVAAFTTALGALAQGIFKLDDSVLPNHGLTVDAAANWYSGTFGMEVWELNATSIPAGINLGPAVGSGVRGYEAMLAAGFVKEATFANQVTEGPGNFALANYANTWTLLPDIPVGSTVVVALAAWNTGDSNWNAMLAGADQATRAGIVAFFQGTRDPGDFKGAVPILAMDRDLVMMAIPEPSPLVLAGLGAALLLLARRRGRPAERATGRCSLRQSSHD